MKPLPKNRAELLRLFFTNPDKKFYMHEIGRILGKKPGIFQRTLNNMVAEGILENYYHAHARYFKVNKHYTLYKELKSIVFKTVGIIGTLRDVLLHITGIIYAFIYGSFAKGKESFLSDIDIIIIGNPDSDELVKKIDKLEERLLREINYKLYTLKSFKNDIKKKNPFIVEILNSKKVMLIGEKDELQKISN